MSVIIRLQGLPWSASTLDIRRFFTNLSIPDGGVHIIGGEKGDAFIAFSTDEGARQAMLCDGRSICDQPVKLFLSSRTEMHTIISVARGGGGGGIASVSQPASQTTVHGQPQQQTDPHMYPDVERIQPQTQNQVQNFTQQSQNMQPSLGMGPQPPMGSDRTGFNDRQDIHRGMMTQQQPIIQHQPQQMSQDQRFPVDQRMVTQPQDHLPQQSEPWRGSEGCGNVIDRSYSPDYNSGPNQGPIPGPTMTDQRQQFTPVFDNRQGQQNSNFQSGAILQDNSGGFHNRNFIIPEQQGMSVGIEQGQPNMMPSDGLSNSQNQMVMNQMPGSDTCLNSNLIGPNDGFQGNQISMQNQRNIDFDNPRMLPLESGKFQGTADIHGDRGIDLRERRGPSPMYDDQGNDYQPMEDVRRFEPRDVEPPQRKRPLIGQAPYLVSSWYIQLRNMPFGSDHKDIRDFLRISKIDRDSIKFLLDQKGKRNGNCMVRITSEDDSRRSLRLNGKSMNGRHVEVHTSNEKTFMNLSRWLQDHDPEQKSRLIRKPVVHSRPQSPVFEHPRKIRYCVEVMGLSPDTEKEQVNQCFVDIDGMLERSLFVIFNNRRQCLGVAYIEFDTALSQSTAISYARNRRINGKSFRARVIAYGKMRKIIDSHKEKFMRPVTRLRSRSPHHDRSEGNHHIDKPLVLSRDQGPPRREPIHNTSKERVVKHPGRWFCVRMRGIPFSCTESEVREFLHGLDIVTIHMVYDSFGKSVGTAFAELGNDTDCDRAVERDRQFIGKRYINVRALPKEDLRGEMEILQKELGGDAQVEKVKKGPRSRRPCLELRNLAFYTKYDDVHKFFEGQGTIWDSLKFKMVGGKPSGEATIEFESVQQRRKALDELHEKPLRGRTVKLFAID